MDIAYQTYTANKIENILLKSNSIKLNSYYLLSSIKDKKFQKKVYHLFEIHADLLVDLKDIGSIYNLKLKEPTLSIFRRLKNLLYKVKTKIVTNGDIQLINDLIINEYTFISQLNSLISNCAIPKFIRERLEKHRTTIHLTIHSIEDEMIDSILQTENLILTK